MDKQKHEYLWSACLIVGGQTSLSSRIGVEASTVNQWLYFVRPIPPKRCLDIEKSTGVKCENLRDDIDWSYLRNTGNSKNTQKQNKEVA